MTHTDNRVSTAMGKACGHHRQSQQRVGNYLAVFGKSTPVTCAWLGLPGARIWFQFLAWLLAPELGEIPTCFPFMPLPVSRFLDVSAACPCIAVVSRTQHYLIICLCPSCTVNPRRAGSTPAFSSLEPHVWGVVHTS